MNRQSKTEDEALAAADRLHGATIRLLRSLRAVDARSGISGPKLSALSVLVFGGPHSLKALAEAEQVRPPTMTRLVSVMEADGLVVKTGATDKRAVRIAATAKGRTVLKSGRTRRLHALAARFARLSTADRAALARALPAFERLASGKD